MFPGVLFTATRNPDEGEISAILEGIGSIIRRLS